MGEKVTPMNQSAISLLSVSLKFFTDCGLKTTFNNQRTQDKVYLIGVHTTTGSESEQKTQQRSLVIN